MTDDTPILDAVWYDGTTSRGERVRVQLRKGTAGPRLAWRKDSPGLQPGECIPEEVSWPERFSTRPGHAVIVDLHGQGSMQFENAAAFFEAFEAAGGKRAIAERMQTRWGWLLVIMGLAALFVGAFHRWGAPLAAAAITARVPIAWELQVSDEALGQLDAQLLKPTKIPAARRSAIASRFDALARAANESAALAHADYRPKWRLLFRSGPGPNAFALPGGTIVLLDGLVEEADKLRAPGDAVAGVLAHEIGHVVYRHTTRMVVEQAVLNVAFGILAGDITSFASFAGSAVAGLSYQRDHETQADCFAAGLMARTGSSTEPMAELLLALNARLGLDPQGAPMLFSIVSSHPGTVQRAQQLKSGRTESCAR